MQRRESLLRDRSHGDARPAHDAQTDAHLRLHAEPHRDDGRRRRGTAWTAAGFTDPFTPAADPAVDGDIVTTQTTTPATAIGDCVEPPTYAVAVTYTSAPPAPPAAPWKAPSLVNTPSTAAQAAWGPSPGAGFTGTLTFQHPNRAAIHGHDTDARGLARTSAADQCDGSGQELKQRNHGQALAEFGLVLPLLVLLFMAIFDFGRFDLRVQHGVERRASRRPNRRGGSDRDGHPRSRPDDDAWASRPTPPQ